MNAPVLLQAVLAMALMMLLLAIALVPMLRRRERIDARIRAVAAEVNRSSAAVVPAAPPVGNIGTRMLRALGRAVVSSGLLSRKSMEDLEQTVVAAGQRPAAVLPLFVGAKVALFIGLPILAWVGMRVLHITFHPTILPVAGAAVVGLLAPDYLVRRARKQYLQKLEAGLPDALDLLIICSEAGLALEAGFDRVAAEFGESNPATAQELRTTASEMKILADRRGALLNMGTRTGLEVMVRLGGTLAQTIQYGTPVSQALRVLAEMRQTTLTRFEEKAARLPVMLTIPMIIFILPCVFLIVGGPAVVSVMSTLMHHR